MQFHFKIKVTYFFVLIQTFAAQKKMCKLLLGVKFDTKILSKWKILPYIIIESVQIHSETNFKFIVKF